MTDITTPFPATHKLGLYPVVDSVEWIARLLEAGVTTIQLRIKDLPDEQVEADIAAAIAGPALSGAAVHQRLLAAGDQARRLRRASGPGGSSIPPIWRPFTAPGCGWAYPPMTTPSWRAAWRSYIALGHLPHPNQRIPSAPQDRRS